ncbi:DUF1249 domain-containing protein [Alkalimonas amylolytica]|uniref:Dehydrogenase n=1 Tax=Alkalimonas amylolytica TaxID=152573 RepID=A0A1H3XM80_ALKAM|nr:DUF1249 domain-containing protein [Alkalimonas amylolytica]SEA00565.1 hypothetical protein SAMN04488051_101311 [Alkalimonas amylolytica]
MTAKPKYRPKLPDFLSLCERNFAQLSPLLPAEHAVGERQLIGLDDTSYFRLEVLEVCPYTTVLRIVPLQQSDWPVPQPAFDVRLYHDARLAEVISCHGRRGLKAVYDYPNTEMLQPDEKRQVNRLLSDWLRLCRQQGFRAEPVLS